jgi:hypothetical protein
MPQATRSVLKSYFPKGGKPTSAQFASLIDSAFIFADDVALLGLNNFDATLIYKPGATVVNNKIIYQANQQNGPGNFNILHWDYIAGGTSGTLVFKGLWNADTDSPQLASPTPIPAAGNFWVVSDAGDTDLSGITDWQIGDWAISDGTQWRKLDNSDTVTNAQNEGGGIGIFDNKSGTFLNFKTLTNLDGSVKITDGTSTVDLAIEFDDSSTGTTRTWTAFKIFSELATKEPVITGTGDVNDYYSGNKTFQSLPTGVLGTFLSGLDLTVNQAIDATNTVIQAFGYLQKQITDFLAKLTAHIGNVSNPHSVTKAQVGLSEVPNLKQNLSAVTDPLVTDDSSRGYSIGSVWINLATRKAYICISAAIGGALWVETTFITVFGKHYQRVDALPRTTTTLDTFQTKLLISVPALTGNFRIEWGAVVDNAKKAGEFRLRRLTAPAATIGIEQVFESTNSIERIPIGGSAIVNLTGGAVEYALQFRAVSAGDTQGIQAAFAEIHQTS